MRFLINATAAALLALAASPVLAQPAPATQPAWGTAAMPIMQPVAGAPASSALLAPPAAAAPIAPAPAAAAPAAHPAEAPLLDESAGRKTYRLVDQWVNAGKVDMKEALAPIWVSDAFAVKVTLRRVGYTLGSGQAATSFNPTAPAPVGVPKTTQVVDLAALVQTATLVALSEVESSLSDVRLRALAENVEARKKNPAIPLLQPNDPRFQTLATLVAREQLLVDLQIARSPQNIAIAANARFGAVYAEFMPGLHGLCMTRNTPDGKTQQAWIWPADALAFNEDPHSQLMRLLNQLAYPLRDVETLIDKIARPGGPLLTRFEALHLVRPDHDQPVTALVRGNRLVPGGGMNGQTLEAMAQRLSVYLARRVREGGTMAGTYQPSTDSWEPTTAALADEAMAAYALGRRAVFLTDHISVGPELRTVKDASRQAVDYLSRQLLQNQEPQADPAAAALTLMALIESPHLSDRKEQRDALAAQLLALRTPEGIIRSSLAPNAPAISAANYALVLCALSSLYEQTRDPQLLPIIRQGQQQLWKADKDNQLAALPWVAILDLRMHRLADKDDRDEAARWETVSKYLAALAKGFHDKQVAQNAAAADLAGGYDLASDVIHGPPGPDWRTAYVLTFLAAYLRAAPPVAASGRIDAVMECGQAARFLAQLMLDAPGCYYVRVLDDAVGGVRLKLWDNRVIAMSTAVTLLATVELQETLANLNRLDSSVNQAAKP